MNDLLQLKFDSKICCYADDLKIFGTPGLGLQCDIDKIFEWSQRNGMSININKSFVVHFGKHNNDCEYRINGTPLIAKQIIKDLGVTFDNSLKFAEHLKIVKNKCYKLINMIFKIFRIKDQELYCKLYKIYIRSVVLYGLPIYLSNTSYCIGAIEKIQKYFTRRLYRRLDGNVVRPPYLTRLKSFGLEPLESLCMRSDLTFLFKLTNDLLYSSFQPAISTRKPSRFIFQAGVSRTYHNSFFHRSLALWNKFIAPKFNTFPTDYTTFITFLSSNQSIFSLR